MSDTASAFITSVDSSIFWSWPIILLIVSILDATLSFSDISLSILVVGRKLITSIVSCPDPILSILPTLWMSLTGFQWKS